MNVVTTRFGVIQAPDSLAVRMVDGLVGYRGHTRFIHLADPVAVGLSWLQSLEAPELAFALVPPPLAVADYHLELRPGDLQSLELDDERSALTYLILNRGDDGGLAVNLQGPLLFNPARRLGRQVVLTSRRYAVRFPIGGRQALPMTPAAPARELRPLRAIA